MLDVSTRTLQMLAIATMVPAALACSAATAGLEPVIVDIAVGGAVGLSVPSGEGATSLVLVEERAPWTAPPTPPGGPYFETRMSWVARAGRRTTIANERTFPQRAITEAAHRHGKRVWLPLGGRVDTCKDPVLALGGEDAEVHCEDAPPWLGSGHGDERWPYVVAAQTHSIGVALLSKGPDGVHGLAQIWARATDAESATPGDILDETAGTTRYPVATSWGALIVRWRDRGPNAPVGHEFLVVDRLGKVQLTVPVGGVREADLAMCRDYVPWAVASGGRLAVVAMVSADPGDLVDASGRAQTSWKFLAVDEAGKLETWAKIAIKQSPHGHGMPPPSLTHVDSERVLVTWTEERSDGSNVIRLARLDHDGLHTCVRPVAAATGAQQVQGRLIHSDDGAWLLVGWVDAKGRTPSLLLPLEGTTCPQHTLAAPAGWAQRASRAAP